MKTNPVPVPLPPLDPVSGLRTLPVWAAQPYVRAPKPAQTDTSGNVTPLETAEAREALADSGSSNVAQRCTLETKCSNIAATQCPRSACITHCREAAAIATGMDPAVARAEAAKGGLEGRGCDAHEEKVRARKLRQAAKNENKRAAKKQKKDSKKEQIPIDM
jgi:tRNA-dihydrouridine synthase 1